MIYRLYRCSELTVDADLTLLLGAYRSYDDAVVARDDDTVAQLARTAAGCLLQAHHRIVGPGVAGPGTRFDLFTEMERSIDPSFDDLADTREWLRSARPVG